jgi:hypothetical protein
MTRTNPRHLEQSHPVMFLLRSAAQGGTVTTADLDRFLVRDDLPEGENLNRFRRNVVDGVAQVRAQAQDGNFAAARAQADQLAGDLAARMTDDEASVTSEPNPESVDEIAARMFRR